MRVCLDVQPAIAQRTGVGRYTAILAQELDRHLENGQELRLAYFNFRGRPLPFPTAHATSHPVRWCPGRIAQKAWQYLNWPPYESFCGSADVFHFPNFIVPPVKRGRCVVTIHDMSFIRHPECAEARNRLYLTRRIHDTAARADAIITDSHFSAAEIRELLPVAEDRVFPIHLGIDGSFSHPGDSAVAGVREKYGLDRPYLLTVGTIEPRKNLTFMVEVFEQLADFAGQLVVAGMPGWRYEPILARIRDSKRAADIRVLNYIGDGDLPGLYAGAELFLITSLYEGFGFPPLEAMACGTPAVASTGGSLKEVLTAGAVRVDHFDANTWAAEIQSLLADETRRHELGERGRKLAAGYTWTETAHQTWNVYKTVAGVA